MFRITYKARSFLDYRVPVFAALDELTGGSLHVLYSEESYPAPGGKEARGTSREAQHWLPRGGPTGPQDHFELRQFFGADRLPAWGSGRDAEYRPGGNGFFQWTSFALLHRVLHRTPLVICYERTFHTERKAQWYRTLYRKTVLSWVDAMACNGILSATYAQWLGMPADRITLGHMVADTAGLQKAAEAFSGEARQATRRRWGDPEGLWKA